MIELFLSEDARDEAGRRLAAVEADEGVRIVYACESGSRAWGFPSTDSDYDVRFLYVRPRDWYLSVDLEHRRDVIERPIDGLWDVNGWDLRKALKLLRKSNPPLLEWLQSPLVYREHETAAERLRAIAPGYYAPSACTYHYLHMARGNFREFLRGETVRLKKYFYVLRPLLAIRWIETRDTMPPLEFERLVEATVDDPPLEDEVARLLAAKRADRELGEGPRIERISGFIESELKRHETSGVARSRPVVDVEGLNEVFRWVLGVVWGE